MSCTSFLVLGIAVVLKQLSYCLSCAKPQLRFDVCTVFKHGHKLKQSVWKGFLDAPLTEGSIKCGLVVQHVSLQDVSCFAKRFLTRQSLHLSGKPEENPLPACEPETQEFLTAVFPSVLWS